MIYCVGDSFTAGDELPDWPGNFDCVRKPYPTSKYAWPALLETLANHPVKNLGRGGCGNNRIIKRTIDAVLDGAEIVVIAWTSPLRIELADQQSSFDIWFDRNVSRMINADSRGQLVKWLTVHHNTDEMMKWYYAQWLRQVILLQSFLRDNNQKYLMVSADPYEDRTRKYSQTFEKLFNKVDPTYFLGWPTYSMQDWTNGCAKGPGGHFLEDGHKIVAEKINEHIRNLGWIS